MIILILFLGSDDWIFDILDNENRIAIKFWIETKLRTLSIDDLSVIKDEDLFYLGLEREDLDLSSALILIADWENEENMQFKNAEQREITRRKILAIKNKLGL